MILKTLKHSYPGAIVDAGRMSSFWVGVVNHFTAIHVIAIKHPIKVAGNRKLGSTNDAFINVNDYYYANC